MLEFVPEQRASAAEMLKHPWLDGSSRTKVGAAALHGHYGINEVHPCCLCCGCAKASVAVCSLRVGERLFYFAGSACCEQSAVTSVREIRAGKVLQ